MPTSSSAQPSLAEVGATQRRELRTRNAGWARQLARQLARLGVLYNEIPDRIADVIVLAGAGYATGSPTWGAALGWAAATLALFTVYVRVLAGSLRATQSFAGPMAKQHRMFTMTAAAMTSAAEAWLGLPMRAMPLGLAIVVSGSIITIARRIRRMARELEAR